MTFLHFHRATNVNVITFNAITVGAVVVCGAMVSLPSAMAVPIGGVVPSTAATNGVSGPRRPGPITTTSTSTSTSTSNSNSIITSSAPKVAKGRPMIIPTASEVRAD